MSQEATHTPPLPDEVLHLLETDRIQTLLLISGEILRQVREPLQVIRGRAEALCTQLDHYQKDNAQGILDQLQNLESLLVFIENVVSPGPDEVKTIHPFELIEDLTQFFQPRLVRGKIQIMNLLPPERKISISVRDFKQIITAIVINGIEALEKIEASPSTGKVLLVQYQRVKNQEVFSFEDNGNGVSAEELQNLFRPFHSNKKGHIGLSLALCRKIGQVHGWQMKAFQQQVGQGARLELWIP